MVIDSVDKEVKEWMYIHKTLAEKKVWQANSSESMPCPHFFHVCVTVVVVKKIFTTTQSFGCLLLAEKGQNTHSTAHSCCWFAVTLCLSDSGFKK